MSDLKSRIEDFKKNGFSIEIRFDQNNSPIFQPTEYDIEEFNGSLWLIIQKGVVEGVYEFFNLTQVQALKFKKPG